MLRSAIRPPIPLCLILLGNLLPPARVRAIWPPEKAAIRRRLFPPRRPTPERPAARVLSDRRPNCVRGMF